MSKLRFIRRCIAVHKNTLPFETERLGFVPRKEILVNKIAIVSTSQSNLTLNGSKQFSWQFQLYYSHYNLPVSTFKYPFNF